MSSKCQVEGRGIFDLLTFSKAHLPNKLRRGRPAPQDARATRKKIKTGTEIANSRGSTFVKILLKISSNFVQ